MISFVVSFRKCWYLEKKAHFSRISGMELHPFRNPQSDAVGSPKTSDLGGGLHEFQIRT